jgi:beta-galactosidase
VKGDLTGAEAPDYDDSEWRTLDLPHDWSIEDLSADQADTSEPHESSKTGPFSKASIGKMGTGFTVGGTAWYRKTFTIDKADKDKIACLQFDGIYMNSDVWINGRHVGHHPYGYTSFWFDITPYLNPAGQPNVVAVQVKNEGKNARWYSGSGIYRHTWLTLTDPVHIGMWGVYVTTPVVSEEAATVEIATTIENRKTENESITLLAQITDASGNVVGTAESSAHAASDSSTQLIQQISIKNPALWSTEDPTLYQARVTVWAGNKKVDAMNATFGIRTLKFDAETGFSLNGKSMELKGGCIHHDNGPLGAAAIDRAEERKIELLKKAGFNAIRSSHNPPSPSLLDACDRLGMLVIDEIYDMWELPKMATMSQFFFPDGINPMDVEEYSKYFKEWWQRDIRDMVVRDRNHPSVMMWSIGNEIPEAADTAGLRIAKNLSGEVRKYDPTRAVTQACVDFLGVMTGESGFDKQAPVMELLDVVGYNYSYMVYEQDHAEHPDRVLYGSETHAPVSLENWQQAERHPYVIGGFTWTAMDYLGEAGIGLSRLVTADQLKNMGPGLAVLGLFFNQESWPVFNAFCGDIDLIGNPKAPFYYQQVVWRNSKAEMLVHRPVPEGLLEMTSPWGFPDELKSWSWNGHEGEKLQVHVYTRSQQVKLELNGKVVGEQAVDDNHSITATFEVPYEPGTLTARCFDNGAETASETIRTAGNPAAIRLSPDRSFIRADRNDLSFVMVEITDDQGNLVPYADDVVVNFEITGNGEIAGAGNGDPADMSSFQMPRKKTWQGRCLAIVRPLGDAGKIQLTASAEGLKEATVEIMAE